VDNHDGQLPGSGVAVVCVDTETLEGQQLPHVIYRSGFYAIHANKFNESGEFVVRYTVSDDAANQGATTRTITVQAQASASSGGDSGGGAVVASVVVILVLLAAVGAFVYKRQQDRDGRARSASASNKRITVPPGSAGLTHFISPAFNAGTPRPPPPEKWYHGTINRVEAEARLQATPTKEGVFLLRSRGNGADGEYAISVKNGGKIVHYTATVPFDRSSALLVQGKPTSVEFGSSISDVLAHLRDKQPGFPIASGLRVPAAVPTPNQKKLAELVQLNGTLATYQRMSQEPAKYNISTAYELDHSGLYYPIFVAPSWIHAGIPLYARDRLPNGSVRFVHIDPADVGPAASLFVLVKHEDLPFHLGIDNYSGPDKSSEPVLYSSPISGVGQTGPDGVIYSAVNVGATTHTTTGESDVLYSAVNTGGAVNPLHASQIGESGVLYSAVNAGTVTPLQGAEPIETGLLYSALDHADGEEDIVYSALAVESAMDDSGVLYSAMDVGAPLSTTSPAVPTRASPPAPASDVLYSPVVVPAPSIEVGVKTTHREAHAAKQSKSMPPKIEPRMADAAGTPLPPKRGTSLRLDQAAAPTGADWLHTVNRGEAENLLTAAGKEDGLYLIRPKGKSFVLSIVLRGRFVHRLIESDGKGGFLVDKVEDDWGSTVPEVAAKLEGLMMRKHALNQCRQLFVSDLAYIGAGDEC
jgi:hypothetical protein